MEPKEGCGTGEFDHYVSLTPKWAKASLSVARQRGSGSAIRFDLEALAFLRGRLATHGPEVRTPGSMDVAFGPRDVGIELRRCPSGIKTSPGARVRGPFHLVAGTGFESATSGMSNQSLARISSTVFRVQIRGHTQKALGCG